MEAIIAHTSFKPVLTIRIHLTDGLVEAFSPVDTAAAEKLWNPIDPSRIFVSGRLIIGNDIASRSSLPDIFASKKRQQSRRINVNTFSETFSNVVKAG